MSSSSSSDKSANAPATCTWVIDNFVNITDSKSAPHGFQSPNNIGSYFLLLLHPKSYAYESNKVHTVVVLSFLKEGTFKFPLSVQYQLSIIGANGEKYHTRDMSTEFVNKNSVDTQYNLNWAYLTNPANRLLVNGKLTIYCEVYVLDGVQVDIKSRSPTIDSKISHDYGSLLENGKFADITLVVGENDFKAHKLVLAARSPVFYAMFEHTDTKESQKSRVDIEDMSVEVFVQMLRYIYTGKIDSLEQHASELFQAADRYQLNSLKSTCEQYLGSSLTVDTVSSVVVLADMHSATYLKQKCIEYLIKHAIDVVDTDGWNNLVESHSKFACQLLKCMLKKGK